MLRKILKRNCYTSYITIPKEILEKTKLKNDDLIEISTHDDIIIITKKDKKDDGGN